MNKRCLSLLIVACSYSAASQADIYITPMVGYGMGGSLDSDSDESFDIDRNVNYNLAIETNVDKGRLGLLYSEQQSSIDKLDVDTTLRYLHFQSAVYYPVDNWNSYLGLGLGGTQIDIQGADTEYKFSLGVYGGVEYKITKYFALQGQLRYMGTLVDSESLTLCDSSASGSNCKVAFSGNWMNQLQANVGFTISF
ncbi:outer membrane beta-barrel protein [Vibrio ezurae]|uniref:Outer membrane protein beta-barrel domain-containing protein n=1 Tax=Vibrio ezurae NBRC 102218 TaxID=1219080 RepID=U3AYP8_9VIBR|nr:outer membrane beta-barrel protein [Vibrio ezurae]GAD78860.1 hypothetical protein VEZ01S_07_00370 [Vibrio ezurae NBRC 102218]